VKNFKPPKPARGIKEKLAAGEKPPAPAAGDKGVIINKLFI
jgi:hypothetical protein